MQKRERLGGPESTGQAERGHFSCGGGKGSEGGGVFFFFFFFFKFACIFWDVPTGAQEFPDFVMPLPQDPPCSTIVEKHY